MERAFLIYRLFNSRGEGKLFSALTYFLPGNEVLSGELWNTLSEAVQSSGKLMAGRWGGFFRCCRVFHYLVIARTVAFPGVWNYLLAWLWTKRLYLIFTSHNINLSDQHHVCNCFAPVCISGVLWLDIMLPLTLNLLPSLSWVISII